MVDAVECTALEHTENPLMTPPCDCPRCAPPQVPPSADGSPHTIWIPVGGRPVRHEVHNMELGTTGHALLG